MAPLPDNNTDRYFYDYQQGPYQHTFVVRTEDAATLVQVDTAVDLWLSAFQTYIRSFSIIGVRFQDGGTNISVPVASALVGTAYGTGSVTIEEAPRFINFVGRSALGRRVSIGVYGFFASLSNWRITSAEDPIIGNAVDELQTPLLVFMSIDEQKPLWYPYANTGYDAYWQREVRA